MESNWDVTFDAIKIPFILYFICLVIIPSILLEYAIIRGYRQMREKTTRETGGLVRTLIHTDQPLLGASRSNGPEENNSPTASCTPSCSPCRYRRSCWRPCRM